MHNLEGMVYYIHLELHVLKFENNIVCFGFLIFTTTIPFLGKKNATNFFLNLNLVLKGLMLEWFLFRLNQNHCASTARYLKI